eukprot:207299-Ditylum_brightwellii.AAC.1
MFKKKDGMKDKFVYANYIYISINLGARWYMYVIVNPIFIKESIDETSKSEGKRPILLSMDGFYTDKFAFKFIMKTVVDLCNYFLSPDQSLDHDFVSSANFNCVNAIRHIQDKMMAIDVATIYLCT